MKLSTHVLKEGVFAYHGLYIKKRCPVIVLAPGRVGSVALNYNLRDAGIFSFKVEGTDDPRGSAQFALKHIVNKKRSAQIISIVRDPVEMMIGYFYSKAFWGHLPGSREALEKNDLSKLQEIFISEVLSSKRLDKHLYWYENEFIKLTGINVFQHSFSKEDKFVFIDNDTYPTLIFRLDLSDEKKTTLVKDFLKNDSVKITRANTRDSKPLSDGYDQFKNTLVIPENIIEKIYSSTYCQHFFSRAEITEKLSYWSK